MAEAKAKKEESAGAKLFRLEKEQLKADARNKALLEEIGALRASGEDLSNPDEDKES